MEITYIITKTADRKFTKTTSKWSREIGDQLNFEGVPQVVIFATTQKAEIEAAWAAINKQINRINYQIAKRQRADDARVWNNLLIQLMESGVDIELLKAARK